MLESYNITRMIDKILDKLRLDQGLRVLPNGQEGIPVTVQFQGSVPSLPRPQRRQWLLENFSHAIEAIGEGRAQMLPESISVSGQAIEAVFPTDDYETLKSKFSAERYRVDVSTVRQVLQAR